MDEGVSSSGRSPIPRRCWSCGKISSDVLARALRALPDLRCTDVLEIVEVAVLVADDLLPVPLVHVGAVVVVEEVVLAHRLHVGAAHPRACGRSNCASASRFHFVAAWTTCASIFLSRPRPRLELHGRARPVAVEHVVHAAVAIDDQRHLHHVEIQLATESVFDVALHFEERLHRLHGGEQRLVVVGEDLRNLLVRADSGSREIGLFVRHVYSSGIAEMLAERRIPLRRCPHFDLESTAAIAGSQFSNRDRFGARYVLESNGES